MKKHIILALALSASLSSCLDESYNDWAAPQTNPEEVAQGVTFTTAAANKIDFSTIDETATTVQLFIPNIQASEKGDTVTYKAILSNGDKKEVLEPNTNGEVSVEAFQQAVINLYGKAPIERNIPTTVEAYITIGGQVIKSTSETTITALLVAPFIDSAYYYVGASNGWNNADTTYIFQHSAANVYDDPVFTLTVPAPFKKDEEGNVTNVREDMWFKIMPVSALGSWVGLLGCATNGDESLTGALIVGGEAMNMPASDGALFYKITLNMMDYMYTVEPLAFEPFLFIPGDHQGWAPATAPRLYSEKCDGVYTGFSYLNTQFKFTKHGNWNDGEYNYSNFFTYTDNFSGEGSGNIMNSTPGFYELTANVATGSLTAVASNWGVIGDATADGWNSDQDMTWDAEKLCLTATLELGDGTIKFRANDGWDVNYGGDVDNLSHNGDNITVTAGTYVIDLYLDRHESDNIHCVLTKK